MNEASPAAAAPLARGVWAALAALLLALTVAYVRHPEGRFTRAGKAHGDGVYYYVYLRSLVYDRDFDFRNDYALLGNPHHRPVGAYGLPENRFAIGAGLLWLPTFALAQAATATSNAAGWTAEPLDGSSLQTQRITFFASVLHAAATALAIALLARRFFADWVAGLAGVATVLATPLWWYAVYQPSWPHAASACVVAIFVLLWERGRTGRSRRGWFGLGALLGLVALVRAQDVLFGLLPAVELLLAARVAGQRRATLVNAAVFGLGAALAFSPQMLAWCQIYGSPLTIPQGEGFMLWSASKPGFTLFSSRNGLIAWSPILGLALLGALLLTLRRGPARLLAALLLLVFAAEAYVLGSTRDWWGGWAFGGRRYLGCSVLFGLGLAALIDAAHAWCARHVRLVLAALPVLGVSLFAVCNLSLVHDYFYAEVERGEPQPMRPPSLRAATRGVAAIYDALGHPGAAPASWWFAWRAGVAPERYDAISGIEVDVAIAQHRGAYKLYLYDTRWAGVGFGPKIDHAGQRASLAEGTDARFVLPLRRPLPLRAHLQLAATGPGAALEIAVGGVAVLTATVEEAWKTHEFTIPAEALAAGFNYVTVTQTPPQTGEPPAIAWGSLQLALAR